MGEAIPKNIVDVLIRLVGVFECPVCYNYLTSPIYQCAEGHVICGTCKPTLQECPTCRGSMNPSSRVRCLEEISEVMLIPCKNIGCEEIIPVKDMKTHEDDCPKANISSHVTMEDVTIKQHYFSAFLQHIESNIVPFFVTKQDIRTLHQGTQTKRINLGNGEGPSAGLNIKQAEYGWLFKGLPRDPLNPFYSMEKADILHYIFNACARSGKRPGMSPRPTLQRGDSLSSLESGTSNSVESLPDSVENASAHDSKNESGRPNLQEIFNLFSLNNNSSRNSKINFCNFSNNNMNNNHILKNGRGAYYSFSKNKVPNIINKNDPDEILSKLKDKSNFLQSLRQNQNPDAITGDSIADNN